MQQVSQPLNPVAVAAPTTTPASSTSINDNSSNNNLVHVLCCVCGVPIVPNAVNTCASCLASTSDITRGISTECTLHQCRGCQRWHKEAGKWIACALESRDLMALCISHVSGLKNKNGNSKAVRLVDAVWIWTEPHSMRLKVRLTVQRQVQHGTILQQSFTVLFIVRNQQCIECQSVFRQGSWKSLVQVRQRVSHKRTFLYLEQLILKDGAHRGCLQIQVFKDGMDFYFPDKGKAARFIAFLENACPVRVKCSKKLIGTDDKSNISNFKYTNLVEICPLCKDDLLYLPSKLARSMGNIARLVLVKGISSVIHLMDPLSGQTASMSNEAYWRQANQLRPLITAARSRMRRYIVLGKEPVFLRTNVSKRSASKKQKSRLALVTLAREEDLGVNDVQLEERSHIGYLLKSGDVCLGYDLQDTQFVDDAAEEMRAQGKFPDVILVRKLYGGVAEGSANPTKQRIWKLQRLDADVVAEPKSNKRSAGDDEDMDEEDFMQEVESDRDMRLHMNLYKTGLVQKMKECKIDEEGQADVSDERGDDDEDDDDQKVLLDELLDGLALDQGPDPEDLEEGEKAKQDGLTFVHREEARQVRNKDSAVAVTSGTLGKDFLAK